VSQEPAHRHNMTETMSTAFDLLLRREPAAGTIRRWLYN
jgi:hypothetical protein